MGRDRNLIAFINDRRGQTDTVTNKHNTYDVYIYSDSLPLKDSIKDDNINTLENYLNVVDMADTVHIFNAEQLSPFTLGILLGSSRARGVEVFTDTDSQAVRRFTT